MSAAQPPDGAIGYLWPCNAHAWHCWLGVQTQWRTGMSGRTGLDYAGVQAYLQDACKGRKQRREVFAGIRAAEAAVLDVWAAQQQQQGAEG